MVFYKEKLDNNLTILIINLIYYKYKDVIDAYIFILFIYNKSSIVDNILVFEDLNII